MLAFTERRRSRSPLERRARLGRRVDAAGDVKRGVSGRGLEPSASSAASFSEIGRIERPEHERPLGRPTNRRDQLADALDERDVGVRAVRGSASSAAVTTLSATTPERTCTAKMGSIAVARRRPNRWLSSWSLPRRGPPSSRCRAGRSRPDPRIAGTRIPRRPTRSWPVRTGRRPHRHTRDTGVRSTPGIIEEKPTTPSGRGPRTGRPRAVRRSHPGRARF